MTNEKQEKSNIISFGEARIRKQLSQLRKESGLGHYRSIVGAMKDAHKEMNKQYLSMLRESVKDD